MSENLSPEIWNNALRLGLFRSMNHYRGLLLRGQTLTQDDREGLIDLLNLQEEYMAITWPEAPEAQEAQS